MRQSQKLSQPTQSCVISTIKTLQLKVGLQSTDMLVDIDLTDGKGYLMYFFLFIKMHLYLGMFALNMHCRHHIVENAPKFTMQ